MGRGADRVASVMTITTDPAFAAYALSAVALSLHLIVLDTYGGAVRGKTKTTPNPEDARRGAVVVTEDPEAVARVVRAHRNLFANAVPFLVLGLIMVLFGTSKVAAIAYFATFNVARLGYTFAYLGGKQPYRSICYATGQLATLGIVVHVVRAALAAL